MAPSDELEAQLAEVRVRVGDERSQLAEVRAEAQALAREVELAARRLTAIAADGASWSDRKASATDQIDALAVRLEEAGSERAGLEEAPEAFEEKRRALIGEITSAESERRAVADTLASGENALANADRAARAALEAMGTAREDAARAEERFEGSKRRLADVVREIREVLEIEAHEAAAIAELAPDAALPDITEVESNLEKLRRDRERLGAVTCAPRKNCARSRPSTPPWSPSATT